MEKSNSIQPYEHAMIGGFSSVLALAIWYPLDTLRTLRQTKEYNQMTTLQLIEKYGIAVLYQGMASGLASMGISWYCYYYFQKKFQLLAKRYGIRALTNSVQLCIGLLAGAITCTVANPFWVINTRMKIRRSKSRYSMYSAVKSLLRENGFLAFYNGYMPSLLLVWNPAIQFLVAEHMNLTLHDSQIPTSLLQFLIGGVSKFSSTIITYPLQVIKTRMQVKQRGVSLVGISQEIFGEGGIGLFYAGLEEKLAQTVLTAATMFCIAEILTKFKA
jgi:adenine nucleotide transporter 17